MSREQIRRDLLGIIGYSGEVAEPDKAPVEAYFTDRWMQPRLEALVDYVVTERKGKALAWGAYIESALDQTLEDGTPVLEVVFAHNPDLADRLRKVLGSEQERIVHMYSTPATPAHPNTMIGKAERP